MKPSAADHTASDASRASPPKRRSLLLGVGVAGAAALAAKTLPITPTETAAASPKPAADEKGGYQLTQHVLRYYETTKV
ncbi:MAG TPA: formate dehydrogenase [Albitalea sp.]|jgi:hypothetical protein|nr:formate dehydrogenase [Albitalea sp.]